ncbi:helix-turn-helix domain-containing protein [Streptomyces olivochromogenes]|uniref:helix-turn-helix domain-containing protein n=1 Tax=Streptomyces olivochromogenes TaxID=1963 RepID=UPI0020BD7C0B|nr:helix-turn-helix domain-containing protein [Streptomyces sp. S1D4-11]
MAETKQTPPTPAGEVLAANLKRLREEQRLTYVELSARLTETGRPIPVLGLRRIERGERRVDVDDLLALALVLSTHPVDLLVPGDAADDAPYPVTPTVTTTARTARGWIGGTAFLVDPKSPLEFATAIRTMPQARAQAMTRLWMTPERQHEWNRQALEYDHRQAEGNTDPGGED